MTSIDLTCVITTSNTRRLLYRGSIRRKLVLFVAALVILTTLAIALGGYLFVRQLLLDKVRQGLTMDLATRGEMLQAYIQQQHERMALVASRTKLRQLLQDYAGRCGRRVAGSERDHHPIVVSPECIG